MAFQVLKFFSKSKKWPNQPPDFAQIRLSDDLGLETFERHPEAAFQVLKFFSKSKKWIQTGPTD